MIQAPDPTLCNLLNRAVRAREILVSTKEKHKVLVQKIKEKRNQLMIEMTNEIDGSEAQSKIEREIDSIDQREFQLHHDYKKVLLAADTEINEIIGEITERFGPGWNSNKSSRNAQDDERGATE
jgi:hypothetical protein